jgi:diketogulonate reductase-like aldo/keto reductase
MEFMTLNNGTKIPAAGIGTFLLQPEDAERSVTAALKNGYSLVDTANCYMNEKAVGRAMKASGLKREEIYLVTKLWPSIYAEADKAIDDTLRRLDTDYIDLLFLHQPAGDYEAAYKAIERAVKAGKVRSIGLSNFDEFNLPKLKAIVETCEIKPAVIQVEAHPYYPQDELKSYLDTFGAKIMAWYPLGHGDHALQEEKVFADLAAKYGKSPAQVILRWHTQVGNIVIPGSKNEAHIKDNINIFDFTLTGEELKAIESVNKNVRYYHSSKEALANYAAYAPDFDAQP